MHYSTKTGIRQIAACKIGIVSSSVAYVLGPPGSGSVCTRYGSRSGSFYHQSKI